VIFFYRVAIKTSKPYMESYKTVIRNRYTYKGIAILQTLYDIHEHILRGTMTTAYNTDSPGLTLWSLADRAAASLAMWNMLQQDMLTGGTKDISS